MSDAPANPSPSYRAHQQRAVPSVSCAVLTVSDTRTEADDTGGQLIQRLLAEHGHRLVHYAIVPDEPERIRTQFTLLADRVLADPSACQVILTSGGTGVSTRDRTYEAVAGLLHKRLDGFGELFRMLSFEAIGSGAMLSRAVAGLFGRQVVFCMPGSPHAIELAMTRLILPELGHLVAEALR